MDQKFSDAPATATARLSAAGGVLFMAAGAWVVRFFDPVTAGFFPACPLYRFTGLACPGCGLTRGFHALLHGDVVKALDHNALIPLFVLVIGFLFVTLVLLALRGRGLMKLSASPPFLVGILVVLLSFGVLRNLPFYPFTFLYP